MLLLGLRWASRFAYFERMFMARLILFIFCFGFSAFAVEINLSPSEVTEGQTLLLKLSGLNSSQRVVKGSFQERPLIFFPCPMRAENHCAFVSVAMGTDVGKVPLELTFGETEKQTIQIKVVAGSYRSEELKVNSKRVNVNEKNAERAKKEWEELNEVFKAITDPPYWKDAFKRPGKGKITSQFGNKRVFNGELKSFHTGVDLRGNKKTIIRASNSGVVRAAKEFFYAGNMVVLDHGMGVFSNYAHMSRMDVKPGQKVVRGQVLGRAGATGRVTGPHIHWGMRVSGVRVDPLQFQKTFSLLWAASKENREEKADSQSKIKKSSPS